MNPSSCIICQIAHPRKANELRDMLLEAHFQPHHLILPILSVSSARPRCCGPAAQLRLPCVSFRIYVLGCFGAYFSRLGRGLACG